MLRIFWKLQLWGIRLQTKLLSNRLWCHHEYVKGSAFPKGFWWKPCFWASLCWNKLCCKASVTSKCAFLLPFKTLPCVWKSSIKPLKAQNNKKKVKMSSRTREMAGQRKYYSIGNQNTPTFYKIRVDKLFTSHYLVWESDGIITKNILKYISK